MLEDRHYLRQPWLRSSGAMTVALLVVNVTAFVLQNLVYRFTHFPLDGWFALSVAGLRQGFVWQLLTYQFMHGGWLHLLLNGWAIYVFGRAIEETLGGRSFLTLYFASGVAGGLFQALFGVLLHGVFAAPVVGASAGAFGLVAAFATLYPERTLTLLLFFVLPLNLRAKYLLLFSALLAVFGILVPTDNIAHAAHLGGMVMGLVYVRYAIHGQWRWPRLRRPGAPPVRLLARPRRPYPPEARPARPADSDEDLPPAEFLSQAVDPILDKISAHGIQSLTERERRILETARAKMARR